MSGTATRKLRFWMCTALVVGNMVGSGVFMLPASLAPHGWNSVLGWLFTACGGLLLACVFAGLSSALPQAGGPYAYARLAFGEAPAFLMAWGYWVSMWVGNAAIATGAVSYLSVFFPAIAEVRGLHALVSCALIWMLTAVSCLGVREAGSLQVVTTVLKGVVLLNYDKSLAEVFTFIILLATATNLVPYLSSALAVPRLMWRGRLRLSRPLLAASALAALYSVWMLYGSGVEALLWGSVLMAAGLPVYALVRRRQAPAAATGSAV